MTKVTMIDPPTGWRYGFPKVFDHNPDYETFGNWLIRNGYPESYVELATQYSRYWKKEI